MAVSELSASHEAPISTLCRERELFGELRKSLHSKLRDSISRKLALLSQATLRAVQSSPTQLGNMARLAMAEKCEAVPNQREAEGLRQRSLLPLPLSLEVAETPGPSAREILKRLKHAGIGLQQLF